MARHAIFGYITFILYTYAISCIAYSNPWRPDPTIQPCNTLNEDIKTRMYGPGQWNGTCVDHPDYMPNVNGYTVLRSNRTISTKRFAWSLDDITLQYWESRPLNQDIAFCAFSWFIEYSTVNAFMTNDSTGSTNLLIHWPMVLWSYLRIQDSTALYINQKARHKVESWLVNVTERLKMKTSHLWEGNINNHGCLAYYTALIEMQMGMIENNKTKWDFGINALKWFQDEVHPVNGYIPMAITKCKKACVYTTVSARPIIYITYLAYINGIPIPSSFPVFIKLLLSCAKDEAILEKLASKTANKTCTQDPVNVLIGMELVHNMIRSDEGVNDYVQTNRPMFSLPLSLSTDETWIFGTDINENITCNRNISEKMKITYKLHIPKKPMTHHEIERYTEL